jgi:hypothetical protein
MSYKNKFLAAEGARPGVIEDLKIMMMIFT